MSDHIPVSHLISTQLTNWTMFDDLQSWFIFLEILIEFSNYISARVQIGQSQYCLNEVLLGVYLKKVCLILYTVMMTETTKIAKEG